MMGAEIEPNVMNFFKATKPLSAFHNGTIMFTIHLNIKNAFI